MAIAAGNGSVINVVMASSDYVPPPGTKLIPSDTANIGDVWNGKDFITKAAAKPLGESDLINIADIKQSAFLSRPFSFSEDGFTLVTRCDNASMIFLNSLGLWVAFNTDQPSLTRTFHNLDGSSHVVTVIQMKKFLNAVTDHIQDSFDHYSAITAKIANATITNSKDIDLEWPVN